MAYRVKAPWLLHSVLYRQLTWKMPAQNEPCVYLTFDDGPHPTATPFVLEQLDKFNAKATFFCIGKNIVEYGDIYSEILKRGHTTGNHTHHHKNGWQTGTDEYIHDIEQAGRYIESKLFRPPYGRITQAQIKQVLDKQYKIYMWDILSGDFDVNLSPQKCLDNVLKNIGPGSIIVFHDSQKAWDRMSYALPEVLEHCTARNWHIKELPY